MSLLPFAFLFLALVLFLASMRQISLHWRAPIWIAAAAFVVAAAVFNLRNDENTGLLASLFRHPQIVTAAFQSNWPTIDEYVGPALDVLILLTVLVAVGCLVALTPGEAAERFVRPINIGLMGAVVGGAVVLAISAIGFGPVAKRQVFIDLVDARDVIDGDTLRMGDVGLRIWGIDAPEDHQICLRPDKSPYDCGALAADAMRKLAIPGPVFCQAPPDVAAGRNDGQLEESFGRPLVTCGSDQQGYGNLPDIGGELVRLGYAYPYESPDGAMTSKYKPHLYEALRTRDGLHSGEFLKPAQWRNDPVERCKLISQAGLVTELDANERTRLEKQLKRLKQSCGLLD